MLFFSDGQWRLNSEPCLTSWEYSSTANAELKVPWAIETDKADKDNKKKQMFGRDWRADARRHPEQKPVEGTFKWDSKDAEPKAAATETTSLSKLLPDDRCEAVAREPAALKAVLQSAVRSTTVRLSFRKSLSFWGEMPGTIGQR